ncbi:MAG TPA: DEAD/DEAH box helicase [Gammaproteobacteria bacterium]
MLPATFHPAVRGWFERAFHAPTAVQLAAWEAIAAGTDTVISAPTGSGKTLAGFLAVIDELVKVATERGLPDETRVLYVSPLKALSNDIQLNLQAPLEGIRRELAERMLGDAPIRAWVRTGDTPQTERARMRRSPPHILVTTPESLYILLTSESGRRMLATVGTVIVDEIHALAGNKRGAHLSLSLERLAALCERPPVRVGISATTKPIAAIAEFLTGSPDKPCRIIDEGHARERDLALELPSSPLEAIMPNEVWAEEYDRLAELIRSHRTTLVFVNTRRLAERAARHLAERLGEDAVTSHHGSLAKEHRLNAEQRLKAGKLKAIVATSSLELGIDIGDVDLVCQLGSPRGIASFLQRVGRSGHGIGRVPKGRLFPLSRDELIESAALLDSVRRGELDAIRLCRGALDVLAQQIVAEVSQREWRFDELLALFRRAAGYGDLAREDFEAVVTMLAEGFSTQRGRRSAHIHYDRVNGVLRGRRGAAITAVTNGGVIPDQFDYDVILVPSDQQIGSVNEDFAIESLPGDIFQLGNASYRIAKVQTGKVYVEDAGGQPPSIPFWFGEAPGRSDELSASVSRLLERADELLEDGPEAVREWLEGTIPLPRPAAEQIAEYLAAAKAALGALPTHGRVIFERFFDETGDAHLVIHSPFGSRINRAWGLALRKRFCRRFNFELQAAALEDSIVISLGAVHSFALEDVQRYLSSATARDVLTQAVLGAPIFPTYFRWNATAALAVRRFRNAKKAPPQFQRNDAEDLLATVFPESLACAENLPGGDLPVPDHPLVTQTLSDCLTRSMDVDGLIALLRRLEAGELEVLCRDLAAPSPLAQEILGAKPYAFLDDAPAEERRTLAVQARRYMTPEQAAEIGRLDAAAIERVREEAWPEARDADELHDALVLVGCCTAAEAESRAPAAGAWLADLERAGRATTYAAPRTPAPLWVAAERLAEVQLALPGGRSGGGARPLPSKIADRETAVRELVRSRLEALGPVSAAELAAPLGLDTADVDLALLALEQQGVAMRGRFTGADREEWCERRLLSRIHRYTLKRLRSEIEPVSLADYQRFLFEWQGLGDARREGRIALGAVLGELQGLALPAAVWEREVLPARIADYGPDLIDQLTVAGELVWWRPKPSTSTAGRPTTVATSPIAIVPRSALLHWRTLAGGDDAPPHLSGAAERVVAALERHGASFFVELVQATRLLRVQVEEALGELVARGLVTADSFNGLRALLTPQSRRRGFRGRGRLRGESRFDAAGRWALLRPLDAAERTAGRGDAVEHAAKALLRRYGVVCRAVLDRETLAPPWRELLACYRRAEARGEIRGGRFVAPLGGEQFALIEAVEELRRVRRDAREGTADQWLALSAVDPVNLAGLAGADARVPAIASHRVAFKNGVPVAALVSGRIEWLGRVEGPDRDRAAEALRTRGEPRPPMPRRRAPRGRVVAV